MRNRLKSGTVFCVCVHANQSDQSKVASSKLEVNLPLENYCVTLVAMLRGHCSLYIVLHIACVQYLLFLLCGALALNISSC